MPVLAALLPYLAVPIAMGLAYLLARVLHAAAAWLRAKEAAEKHGSLKDKAYAAMAVLSDCAADAVTTIENTIRPDLKAATADGKISKEDGQMLAAKAKALAIAQAKAAAPKVLEAAGIGDLDGLVGMLVDAAAAKLAGDSRAVIAQSAPAVASAPLASPQA